MESFGYILQDLCDRMLLPYQLFKIFRTCFSSSESIFWDHCDLFYYYVLLLCFWWRLWSVVLLFELLKISFFIAIFFIIMFYYYVSGDFCGQLFFSLSCLRSVFSLWSLYYYVLLLCFWWPLWSVVLLFELLKISFFIVIFFIIMFYYYVFGDFCGQLFFSLSCLRSVF